MNLKSIKKSIPNLWPAFLAFSASCVITRLIVMRLSFNLIHFKGRTVGVSVLDGVDASFRNASYALAIGIFVLVFILVRLIANRLNYYWNKNKPCPNLMMERSVLTILSVMIVTQEVLAAVAKNAGQIYDASTATWLIYAVVLLGSCLKVLFLGRRNLWSLTSWPTYNLQLSMALAAISLALVIRGLVAPSIHLGTATYVVASLIYFCLMFIYCFRVRFLCLATGRSLNGMWRLWIQKAILISAMPLMIVFGNELQFSLRNTINFHPRVLSAVLIVTSMLLYFLIKLHMPKKLWSQEHKLSSLVRDYLFTVFVVSLSIIINYQPLLLIGDNIDLFHIGEFVVPVQQMFQYGSLPFIDLLPTHGISDLFYQAVYKLINGGDFLETMVWNWILVVAGMTLSYLMFSRLMSPLIAALMVFTLPASTLISVPLGSPYFFVIMGGLTVSLYVSETNRFRGAVLGVVFVFLCLWRYDLGIACLSAGLVSIIGMRSKFFYHWHYVFKPFAGVFGTLFIIFGLLAYVRGKSPNELIVQILNYLSIQTQSQSYSSIWPHWGTLAFIHYFVIPAIIVTILAIAICKMYQHQEWLSGSKALLIFLMVAGLILSFRGLHRHSLMEQLSPPMFMALAICLSPILFSPSSRNMVHFAVLTGMLCWGLIAPANSVFTVCNLNHEWKIRKWKAGEKRVDASNEHQYVHFLRFLKQHSENYETFFDFSNAPLLYSYTSKKLPSYIIPNLYHTSEIAQKYQLAVLNQVFGAGKLPYIIFRQGNCWDAIDEVPNEIRSYRITEFIYRNYRPLGLVGPYFVWEQTKRVRLLNDVVQENFFEADIPFSSNVQWHNCRVESSGNGLRLVSSDADPYVWSFLQLNDPGIDLTQGPLALHFRYRSSIRGKVQVFFEVNHAAFTEGMSKWIEIKNTDDSKDEEFWVALPVMTGVDKFLTNLRLDPPDNSEFIITGVNLVQKEVLEVSSTFSQNMNFRKLPYIWANYDDDGKWKKTEIIKEMPILELCPGNPIVLDFGPDIDKDMGNFLRMQCLSNAATKITLTCDDDPTGSITFDLMPSGTRGKNEPLDYLIRISTLWAWMKSQSNRIGINADMPVQLLKVELRKGD